MFEKFFSRHFHVIPCSKRLTEIAHRSFLHRPVTVKNLALFAKGKRPRSQVDTGFAPCDFRLQDQSWPHHGGRDGANSIL